MSRYTFDKIKHLHTLDGKALTGTTTVLQVVAKPMLIQWAATTAVDYIKTHAIVSGADTVVVSHDTLEQAKTAHRKKKEVAGTWGTEVHAWIEKYIMACILGSPENASIPLEGLQGEACRHFMKWTHDNKVIFKESEKNIYSEKMWIGGIVDIVCEIDKKLWICDIKTGSGIYPEHFWQMSAYDMCLQEMGLYDGITGHIVLNLKKDGSFEERRSISNEENEQAFLAALTLYRTQEKLKKQVI